ncbi:4-hydroxy-tetrahydrodipicolinate reductase [Oceanobacillus jordanicus]|uniref:4-hydroxy-tetrahydrodipicolinate reductase n=1 Tax=Oceanobacillus jordanicus TaxID=2867266 RepID=A0AAW5B6M7_9BACI|nr:4-hydroxy-tetrahydrodipicolinate reductase [Oceanobacillus jordanicus]MCG3418864.1 4-hydroxy-tetrahydrodipicolinate reductase [Oceanobacillus jordanicus]
MKKIIIAGPRGKMGSEAIKLVQSQEDMRLVACIDRKNNGKKLADIAELPNLDVPIYEDAVECFSEIDADILIELTIPEQGYKHTKAAMEHGIRPVVGTTGFTEEQIDELSWLASERKIGCIIAPNFAIGAVLMMKFSQMAAQYFPDVDIIEKHHDNKLDAPSGTAVKTAEMIKESREYKKQGHADEKETYPGARGADYDGMRIHSVRLPGLVAHQEVIFGSPGQTLTIKHDSINRASFMEGIKLATDKVMEIQEVIYGLENVL